MPVCWTGSCEETAVVSFVSKDAITSAASMSEMSATSTPTVPPSSGVRGLSKDTSAFGSLPETVASLPAHIGMLFSSIMDTDTDRRVSRTQQYTGRPWVAERLLPSLLHIFGHSTKASQIDGF